jgi:hypothetical protein
MAGSDTPLVTEHLAIPQRLDKYPTLQDFIVDSYRHTDDVLNFLIENGGGTGFQISFDVSGAAYANDIIASYAAVNTFKLPAALVGSVGVCQGSSPVDVSIALQINGIDVGSIDIASDAISFDLASDQTLSAGDVITLKIASTKVFDFLCITLKATF